MQKKTRVQMQSQFADVTSAVCEKLEQLFNHMISKESGSMKRSAQEVSLKVLNQRKQDSLNLQEIIDNEFQFQF